MIRIIAISLVLGLLTADTMAAAGDDLHRLFDDYWDHEMEINPFSATSSGINLYNDRVPDVSPAAQTRALEARQRFSLRLNDIDLSSVNANDQLSAEILAFILEHDIALAQFEQWRIPFLSDAGFHSNFGYVVGSTPFNNRGTNPQKELGYAVDAARFRDRCLRQPKGARHLDRFDPGRGVS